MAACLIRRAQTDDAAALADLAGRTFALACPPHTSPEDIAEHVRTKLSVAAIATELATTGMRYYVAQEGPAFVGFAMLVADGERPAVIRSTKPLELRRIYVDQDRHGTAVAGLLMRECLDYGTRHGYDLVWLGTNSENERALKFYRRHGFDIVGDRTFTVGSSVEHDHVLARTLS